MREIRGRADYSKITACHWRTHVDWMLREKFRPYAGTRVAGDQFWRRELEECYHVGEIDLKTAS